MNIHSQDEAENLIRKFLKTTVNLPATDMELNSVDDPSGDFMIKAALIFNGKKVKIDFQVNHYSQMYFESEPGMLAPLDNGGDQTEFWKFLFNSYLKVNKKK